MRNEKKITLMKIQTLIKKKKTTLIHNLQICNQNSEKLNIFSPCPIF